MTTSKYGKPMGRPKASKEGGQNITLFLPRHVARWLREQGGAKWIKEKYTEATGEPADFNAMKKSNKECGEFSDLFFAMPHRGEKDKS